MSFTINSTKEYHIKHLNSLGWELTVCNALYDKGTPLRSILTKSDSYGHLLYNYLSRYIPIEYIKRVIEVGGGYGYLMKDFLEENLTLEPCMLDISPILLQKQKETLKQYCISYREEDIFETDMELLATFDLALLNENMGDFPTLINLNREILQPSFETVDTVLKRVQTLFKKYLFNCPERETFNMNIGAIEALEKLCNAGIPYIFLSEHSCEAVVPDSLRSFICIESIGDPEKISLMGHDEYTIKFSYLQQVARAFDYRDIRGSFADFLKFDMTKNLRFILLSGGRYSDEDEMICQFIEDLYKYEYLILIRQ